MYLQEFIEHFRVLLRKNATDSREDISLLFQKMGMDPTTYQIGKTKVNIKSLCSTTFVVSLYSMSI